MMAGRPVVPDRETLPASSTTLSRNAGSFHKVFTTRKVSALKPTAMAMPTSMEMNLRLRL